jgi:S-(hydroxymethyl)glutathione dehydrogenase/alcohol dehydrogenase
MRAALMLERAEPLTLEDLTPRALGDRDVEVRIDASGVCRSDLAVLDGKMPISPPLVLGHEGAGTVTAVGRDVTHVAAGDRVVATFTPTCGDCWYCRHAAAHLCAEALALQVAWRAQRQDGTRVVPMSGLGTFAEAIRCSEASVVKVESDLPAEQLALIGCGVTTGVGAVLNTAEVEPGASVAVVGCGGVGSFVVQGARIAGAAEILAVDPQPLKREAAMAQGATTAIDPVAGDMVEQVRAATGGRGVDYAFEVVGEPDLTRQAFESVRPGGTAVLVGMPGFDATIELPAFTLFHAEKRLAGSFYGSAQVRREFARLVRLAETGRLDIGAAVTKTWALDEVNLALDALRRGEVIRSVLRP